MQLMRGAFLSSTNFGRKSVSILFDAALFIDNVEDLKKIEINRRAEILDRDVLGLSVEFVAKPVGGER